MLGTVEYGGVQKYVKVPRSEECFDFTRFLQDGLCHFIFYLNQPYIVVSFRIKALWIVIYNFHCLYFFFPVADKFGLQVQLLTEGVLVLMDQSGTEVDEDIFDELLKSGVKNFKVKYKQQPVLGEYR